MPWYAERMRDRTAGRIDWTALAALAASVAAVAAVITMLSVLRLVRQEAEQARLRAGLDSLWHFSAQWEGAGMLDMRSAAASALLAGRPTQDVDSILDFFDQMAALVDHGLLDQEMIWYEFYWPMANYWLASQNYVRQIRTDDPDAWDRLTRIMPRLMEIEGQRRRRAPGGPQPTKNETHDFLTAEVGDAECGEEDEAQRTPL